jgi:hypothetical protein
LCGQPFGALAFGFGALLRFVRPLSFGFGALSFGFGALFQFEKGLESQPVRPVQSEVETFERETYPHARADPAFHVGHVFQAKIPSYPAVQAAPVRVVSVVFLHAVLFVEKELVWIGEVTGEVVAVAGMPILPFFGLDLTRRITLPGVWPGVRGDD